MENNVELIKTFYIGQKNRVIIYIYGKNIDSEDPSFLFNIEMKDNGCMICSQEDGGYEYDSEEDAINAALDYLVDHATFFKADKKMVRKIQNEINNENPEDNIEEVPEDFRF